MKNICEPLLLKMCSWNWEKINKLYMKETSENVFISWKKQVKMLSFTSVMWWEINSKQSVSTWTNEKHFPKTIGKWEFDYGLFTILPRIIVACDFSQSSLKLRNPTSLDKLHMVTWKLPASIKLKFFLCTKLLENLRLVKYLTSVAAPLPNI